jgi:hypothetical protein
MLNRRLPVLLKGAKDIPLLTLMAAATAACSINPVSNMPEVTLLTVEQEKKMGEEEAKKVDQQRGFLPTTR